MQDESKTHRQGRMEATLCTRARDHGSVRRTATMGGMIGVVGRGGRRGGAGTFLVGRKGDTQRSVLVATMTVVILLLGFVANVRWNVHVDRVALLGFHPVRDTDDPDELGLDVPQSEALVHDQLATRRRHRDVNGDRFDACECRPRDFDLHPGGVVQGARDGRDGQAGRVRDEPPRVDGERLGEWRRGAVIRRMKCGSEDVPQ